MIIIWGTNVETVPVGYVADFCDPCREITSCKVAEIRTLSHLYYIPLGKGQARSYIVGCEKCGRVLPRPLGTYASVLPQPAPIELLVQETNPGAIEIATRSLTLRDRAARGEVDDHAVQSVLTRWFDGVLAKKFSKDRLVPHLDLWSGVLFGLSVVSLVLLGIVMAKQLPTPIMYATMAIAGITWMACAARVCTSVRRFVRNTLEPKLAAELAPLRPTPEVIDKAFARFRAEGQYAQSRYFRGARLCGSAAEHEG